MGQLYIVHGQMLVIANLFKYDLWNSSIYQKKNPTSLNDVSL